MRDRADIADELDRTFAASVTRALAVPGTREPAWRLALPSSLKDSIVSATLLDGGVIPKSLLAHYAVKMPEALVDQFFRTGDRRELLWERLSLSDLPTLQAAWDGLLRALSSVGLEAASVVPGLATDPFGRTSIADLYAPTLFASGLPFLGGHTAERALLGAELDAGAELETVLDRQLSGNLVHELCHGKPVDWAGSPPPWHLSEAASLHLGAESFRAHLFPNRVGEAIPGVARFVLLGDGLSRIFSRKAFWSLSAGVSTTVAFGARAAAVFEVAEWQDWLKRRVPPFAFDANDAIDWIKLADATRLDSPMEWLDSACSIDPLDRAAIDRTPSLVEAARALPWSSLPWWHEPIGDADRTALVRAFNAMFVVNRMSPTFQTHPDEVPGGELVVDVERCELSARRRPYGVWAEPATWLVPPPICRTLSERGVKTVRFEGVRRGLGTSLAMTLLALADGSGALSSDLRITGAEFVPA